MSALMYRQMSVSRRIGPRRYIRNGWFSIKGRCPLSSGSIGGIGVEGGRGPACKTDSKSRLARTLYRQLIRWCDATGYGIPLDPIPPVTLMPPLVDGEALQIFARGFAPSDGSSLIAAATQPLVKKRGQIDDDSTFVLGLCRLIPDQSLVEEGKITMPIRDATDIRGAIKVAYGLNNYVVRRGKSRDEAEVGPDLVQKRIALAFDAIKSLNQLTEAVNEKKRSKEDHFDTTGVAFDVGQVVQHKLERWRGVVVGWKRATTDSILKTAKPTSLTRKDYSAHHKASSMDLNEKEQESGTATVQYTLVLDSGDSFLLGGQRQVLEQTGFPVASQAELELVTDSSLSRIRSHWISSKFDRFDSSKNRFIPNAALAYEYAVNHQNAADGVVTNNSDLSENPVVASHNETTDKDVDFVSGQVREGVQAFASQLQRYILDVFSCTKARRWSFLASLERRLSALSRGEVENTHDRFSMPPPSFLRASAILHLGSLLQVTLEISEMLWQRKFAEQNKGNIKFSLGAIVKHKKYGFRGVIVAWDPKPSVDVSRWDGLSHIPNADQFPFYHVIPDQNDCISAFGGERPFRYVCEENLETCPKPQCNIDVDLDTDWQIDVSNSKYDPPDELKFKFAADLGDEEQAIISSMKNMNNAISCTHLAVRDGTASGGWSAEIVRQLSLDNIFLLLKTAENMEDATVLEEVIKEIWKAHRNEELRWRLDMGVSELTSNDKERVAHALSIFSDLVADDPSYFEAWNKKATCHYMLGDMQSSWEAAQQTLDLHPCHFQALNGLGLVQHATKRYKLAAETFRKSISLHPWSPVSSRLSVCLDLLKDLDLGGEEGKTEGPAPYQNR